MDRSDHGPLCCTPTAGNLHTLTKMHGPFCTSTHLSDNRTPEFFSASSGPRGPISAIVLNFPVGYLEIYRPTISAPSFPPFCASTLMFYLTNWQLSSCISEYVWFKPRCVSVGQRPSSAATVFVVFPLPHAVKQHSGLVLEQNRSMSACCKRNHTPSLCKGFG